MDNLLDLNTLAQETALDLNTLAQETAIYTFGYS